MNKTEFIELIKDNYPMDKSGVTRMINLAHEISNGSREKTLYQDLMIELFEEIPDSEYPFTMDYIFFCHIAEFEPKLYEKMANFIINDFPEPENHLTQYNKILNRGYWLRHVTGKFPELFTLDWFNKSNLKLQQINPQLFLEIQLHYDLEAALISLDKLIQATSLEQRFNTLSIFLLEKAVKNNPISLPYLQKYRAYLDTDGQTLFDHFIKSF
jgi:hypothetical protein